MSYTGFLMAWSTLPTTGLALAITALHKFMETWCVKVESSMVDCRVDACTRAYYSPVLYVFDTHEDRVDQMSEFETALVYLA